MYLTTVSTVSYTHLDVYKRQDVDEMILQDGRQMRRYEHMAVGIAQKGLLEDKEYDLILHASLG